MIKTIIFDVDGTLLDTEKIYMKAWAEAAKARGFEIPQEALRKTRAVNAKVAKATFQEYCGEDFPYDLLRTERVSIAEQMIAETSVDSLLKPNVHQVLQWLKQNGILIAAASSTNYKTTVEHLKHAGLYDYFSVIVGGDMITKGKPEPDIFLKSAELLGIPPKDCFVFEDSENGIIAGSRAGMKCIGIKDMVDFGPEIKELMFMELSNLSQAIDIFKDYI